MQRCMFVLVLGAFLGATGGVAYAGSIPIFNTGVDDYGVPLTGYSSNPGQLDPHYYVVVTEDPVYIVYQAFVINDGVILSWLTSSASRWISAASDAWADAGTYAIETFFDLTGLNPATASLTGQWATDNPGLDIYLNGNSLGIENSQQFASWTPLTIDHGFTSGVNTLRFIVENQGGPMGLRVELSGTADVGEGIPEPATVTLGLLGLASLTCLRRFRAP